MAITENRASYAGFATRQLILDGGGPPVVLLHGFSHVADVWRPVMMKLAETGNTAIAVDLPGFGDADHLRPGALLPQLDEFVADLVATWGSVEPVVLVGNSLGGAVAVRCAARERGLPISALVPIGVAGIGWTPLVQAVSSFEFAALRLAGLAPLPPALGEPVLARLLYGDPRAADREIVGLLSNQLKRPSNRRRLLELGARFGTETTRSVIDNIACPTTVVHGRLDRIVSAAGSQRLAAAIPGSRLVVLDDAGHCPQLDAVDEIASIVSEHAQDWNNSKFA